MTPTPVIQGHRRMIPRGGFTGMAVGKRNRIGSALRHRNCSSSNKCFMLEKNEVVLKESGKCKLMH